MEGMLLNSNENDLKKEEEDEGETDDIKEESPDTQEPKKEKKITPRNINRITSLRSELEMTKEEFNTVTQSLNKLLPGKLSDGKIRRLNLQVLVPVSDDSTSTMKSKRMRFKSTKEIHMNLELLRLPRIMVIYRARLCDNSEILLVTYHHRKINYEFDCSTPTYDFGVNYGTGDTDFYIVIRGNNSFIMTCIDSGTGYLIDHSKLQIFGSRPSVSISSLNNSTSFFHISDGIDYSCQNPKNRDNFLKSIPWLKNRMNEKVNVVFHEMEVFVVF